MDIQTAGVVGGGLMGAGIADTNAWLGRVQYTIELEPLAASDMVLEAVFEDLDLKRQLFINRLLPAPRLLCSNTSGLFAAGHLSRRSLGCRFRTCAA